MHYTTNVSSLIREVELKHNPIIIRVNKFDEESAKDFSMKMAMAHNTGQKVIPIVIDSYGGQVYSLMSMIANIKAAELPVATIIEGKAMSCGAILFSFGEDGMRYMDKDATLMIHDVSSVAYGKNDDIQVSASETKRLNDKVYTMMARNCGHPDDYFKKIIHDNAHADWFLEAEDAKKHKLANHLRVPKLEIKVDVSIEMM